MQVEFLYWESCPSHDEAWRRLQESLRKHGVKADVRRIRVETDAQAEALRFPGSPTIRFNGVDVQPERAERMRPALTCRVYEVDGRVSPLPTQAMIDAALERALGKEPEKESE